MEFAERTSESRPWVCVREAGSGPALIAIPPAQGSIEVVWPVFAPMSDRCRVLGYSLRGERGHGVAPDFGFEELVEDLGEVYRVAGIEQAILAGTSFGGAVALQFALAHPEQVRALILNVTTARMRNLRRSRYVTNLIRSALPFLGPVMVHLYTAVLCTPELVALGPQELGRALGKVRRGVRAFGSPGQTVTHRIDLLFDMNLENRLEEIRCPTLVLSGSRFLDRLVPRRSQRALWERIPDARQAVAGGTGHLGVLTKPAAVREAIANFVLLRPPGVGSNSDV